MSTYAGGLSRRPEEAEIRNAIKDFVRSTFSVEQRKKLYADPITGSTTVLSHIADESHNLYARLGREIDLRDTPKKRVIREALEEAACWQQVKDFQK